MRFLHRSIFLSNGSDRLLFYCTKVPALSFRRLPIQHKASSSFSGCRSLGCSASTSWASSPSPPSALVSGNISLRESPHPRLMEKARLVSAAGRGDPRHADRSRSGTAAWILPLPGARVGSLWFSAFSHARFAFLRFSIISRTSPPALPAAAQLSSSSTSPLAPPLHRYCTAPSSLDLPKATRSGVAVEEQQPLLACARGWHAYSPHSTGDMVNLPATGTHVCFLGR